MRVAVTGGNGKAGRCLVTELVQHGHEVVGIDRDAAPGQASVPTRQGDLLDLPFLLDALQGCDAVAHLAAIPRPGLVPDEVLFHNNVGAVYNVHEAASRVGIRRVVSAGSTATLGWDWGGESLLPSYLPIDEEHPTRPEDAYGLSKLIGEQISRTYGLRGIETPVLRFPWIANPDELADLRRRGGRIPDRFRPYAYVDVRDAAAALRAAIERPGLGHLTLFVAADDSVLGEPLSEVLPRLHPGLREMAAVLTGFRSALSSARAKRRLGWKARHGWRDGTAQAG